MKKLGIILLCVVVLLPYLMAAWDSSLPADSSAWNDAAGFIRDNWDALEDGTAPINFWGPVKNVTHPDYGATVNDGTDDTTAIQAAIDAAHAIRIGGVLEPVVYIPPGQFMVSNLTIYNGTKLVGDGPHHSRLKMITGSTGNMIEDDDSAVGTIISDLMINGNSCNANGIVLGYGTSQFSSSAELNNLYVNGFNGASDNYAIKINNNVAYAQNLELVANKNGLKVDGNLFILTGAAFSGSGGGIVGLDIDGSNTFVRGLHFEGAWSTAAIRCQDASTGTSIRDVHCYIAAGNTINTVVEIETIAARVRCDHISVSMVSGTLTNGIIYDQTLAVDRKVIDTDTYYVESYTSGQGYVSRQGHANVPPDEGTWVYGDIFFNTSAGYGEAIGWVCEASGSPGTWASMGTSPGHQDKTATYSVLAADTGKRFSNTGAGGAVEFDLPADAENLEYEFTKITNQAVTIDPSGADAIQGLGAGVVLTLTNVGDSVKISWLTTSTWRAQYYDATIYVP